VIRRGERLKERPDRGPEARCARQDRPEAREHGQTAALQASRRADADQLSHQQAEMLVPLASSAIRFRNVTADADRVEIHHHLIAVIALVADDLLHTLAVWRHRLDLFGGFDQRLDARRRIARAASCTVTPTTAPVSRSTACSAFWAKRSISSSSRTRSARRAAGSPPVRAVGATVWRLRPGPAIRAAAAGRPRVAGTADPPGGDCCSGDSIPCGAP
jgi:hypothetical protein